MRLHIALFINKPGRREMTDNAQAYATLSEWINQLKSTKDWVESLPEKLAPIVQEECVKAIQAGESLDGDKWAPRKEDGAQALQGTEKDVTVEPNGPNQLLITIRGGLVYSQFGTKHQKRRSILPIKGMPYKLGEAIAQGVIDLGPDWMNRSGRHKKFGRGPK